MNSIQAMSFISSYTRSVLSLAIFALLNEEHPLMTSSENNEFEEYLTLDTITEKNTSNIWDFVANSKECVAFVALTSFWSRLGFISFDNRFKAGIFTSVAMTAVFGTITTKLIVHSFANNKK